MAKYHDQLCVGRLAFAERPTLPEGSSHSVNPHDNEVPVAYSDPGWHRKDWHTPYYLESHRELQKYIRRLVDKHITPYVSEWDKQGRVPAKIFKLLGEKGILAAAVGGSHFPSELLPADVEPPGNVSVDEWDSFHELVLLDEFSRCGSAGFCWGVFGGVTGGLPPIIEFGSKGLVESVGRAVLAGDRVIALAVTEPYCGTDVANILCSAKLSQDGTHFVLNGEKKWVTNGALSYLHAMLVIATKAHSIFVAFSPLPPLLHSYSSLISSPDPFLLPFLSSLSFFPFFHRFPLSPCPLLYRHVCGPLYRGCTNGWAGSCRRFAFSRGQQLARGHCEAD